MALAFFSPRLLRNIKLVCDFGRYFGERKELDPLVHVKQWYDRTLHACAREIIKDLGSRLNTYFHEIRAAKDQEIVQVLSKALLALMLSSHTHNLLHHQPNKSCAEYFADFQGFLREALQSSMYRKWMAYPPLEDNQLAFNIIDILHTLCRSIYVHLKGMEEMKPIIQGLIQEATATIRERIEEAISSKKIMNKVATEYGAMSKLIKHHSKGPLFQVLKILEENAYHAFDPILQHNIPNRLFDLYVRDKRYAFFRIPSPVYQEFINRALINDEFRAFLRSYARGALPYKHLLINLQDRTSWREFVRCSVLEDLQYQSEFENVLSVVTLATDTDFYHQLAPYHQTNHAHLFKEQFKEHLLATNAGYFFPSKIDHRELSTFIDGAFDAIHQLFFSSKNVLARENRLDFVEIFYLLIQLKLIEWLQPDTISLTCKDAIDIGEANSTALFAFLKLINHAEWTEADWDHFNFMLYAPALLIRERIMLPERFNRVLSALKVVENVHAEFGAEIFAKMINERLLPLFKTPILHPQISLPR